MIQDLEMSIITHDLVSIPNSVHKNTDEDITTQTCTICYEIQQEEDFKTLSCNHTFCKKCINAWLQINDTCPMCRNKNANANITQSETTSPTRRRPSKKRT